MKKRYRTVNDYYREIFGEKISNYQLMRVLIVPIVMAQWPTVAVPFVRYRGLGMLL